MLYEKVHAKGDFFMDSIFQEFSVLIKMQIRHTNKQMKILINILLIILMIQASSFGQVFMTLNGQTSFFSETPLENISAENKSTLVALNTTTKEVAVRIQNVAFKFPNKLMEEHFNENYIESEKYPLSVFKGKIVENIDLQKQGTYQVSVKGILDMHGVKQERIIKAQIIVDSESISVTSDFNVKLQDHKIDIPKLVFEKIAESIAIKNKFTLTPKKL